MALEGVVLELGFVKFCLIAADLTCRASSISATFLHIGALVGEYL